MINKVPFNLVTIGPSDSGKSTLLGHLIQKSGTVDRNTIEQYNIEASNMGYKSSKYAWAFDKSAEEREQGHTMYGSLNTVETPKIIATVIDTPGKQDYINDTIAHISQASNAAALLVISATSHEFDNLDDNEQSINRIYSTIAFSRGVRQLIVAVNKMDTTKWSEDRFNDIIKGSSNFLKTVGYNPKYIAYVPVSGWTGDNIMEESENITWYKGWTKETTHGVMKDEDAVVAIGHVATGEIQVGSEITILPSNITAEVRYIEASGNEVDEAREGAVVRFYTGGFDPYSIPSGAICCYSDSLTKEVEVIIAKIVVIDYPDGIYSNYTFDLHFNTGNIFCEITELLETVDKRTGRTAAKFPNVIHNKNFALVKVVPDSPICVETYKDFRSLGTLLFSEDKKIVATGIIESVY